MTAKIIFVVSDGRTGSTLVIQSLNHFRNIINLNEALLHHDASNDLFQEHTKHKKFINHLHSKFNSDNLLTAEQFQDKMLKDPILLISEISSYFTDTVVLKIHLTQFDIHDEEKLNWLLLQSNHKFILLERTNYLDVYTSLEIAKQTNIWRHDDTSNIKIKIDPLDFLLQLSRYNMRYNHIRKELKNHGIDYLKLVYEKDLKNYNIDKFTNLIYPWFAKNGIDLTLDPLKEKVNVLRQNNNENIFDKILNREEILDMIKTKNLDINLVDN